MNGYINGFIKKLDKAPLGVLGYICILAVFSFYGWLGEHCVFSIHDQLDETICSYVLMARHLFEGVKEYPEMMNGISTSGLMPSAILFVPLYRILPLFWAFLLQFFIISVTAFGGMYGLMKRLTNSSGIALIVGIIFSMLPFKPIYGLSVMGVPMLLLCYIQLYKKENIVLSFLGIIYFGLSSHLVLIGYVALTYLGIFCVINLWKKRGDIRQDIWLYAGAALLFVTYCFVNFDLFKQLFVDTSSFTSHRVEFINNTENINIWQNIKNIFFYGESEYAPSYHTYLLPICVIIMIGMGLCYKKMSEQGKTLLKYVGIMFVIILANAVLYGLLTSETVMRWKNNQEGFFRYFQANRYYWAYPTLWWIFIGLCFGLIWTEFSKISEWIKLIGMGIFIIPTLLMIKPNLVLYDNINGLNHDSAFTGKQTWQEYYMQDVLTQVDDYIGKPKSDYKIAHVGLSPAPSLIYGYYTIDGYSNNYSLEYKHAFRQIIAKELEKNSVFQNYFDLWGSRCYLFSAEGDDALKSSDFEYQNLEYDVDKMKELGCEYIFSASKITGNLKGVHYEGTFDTEESVYEIWLYRIE